MKDKTMLIIIQITIKLIVIRVIAMLVQRATQVMITTKGQIITLISILMQTIIQVQTNRTLLHTIKSTINLREILSATATTIPIVIRHSIAQCSRKSRRSPKGNCKATAKDFSPNKPSSHLCQMIIRCPSCVGRGKWCI